MIKHVGLSALAHRFNTVFCDVWGVLHNGWSVYDSAVEALCNYRDSGGTVILVTNAPRRSDEIVAELRAMGIPQSAFDALVSSGEVTRDIVSGYAGKTVRWLGTEGDEMLLEGIDITPGRTEEASAVICSDLELGMLPQDYAGEVDAWRARNLPFFCANPDAVVEINGRLVYCGGALADLYKAAGGEVIMAGKPFAPIYRQAGRLAFEAGRIDIAQQRVLAIGDSVRTDAAGAAGIGAGFLFISGSIHAHELGPVDNPDARKIATLLAPAVVDAVGFSPRLVW